MRQWKKTVFVIILIIPILLLGMVLFLSQFHFDFSQDYRSIDGYENIVFKESSSNQCFHLCAWGLMRTGNIDKFDDHRKLDKTSYEYKVLVDKAGAENIWQVVPSPDGKYILYVERIYLGTGITDDEDVYYKVYSIKDDTSVIVYSGFKQFLLVDWK